MITCVTCGCTCHTASCKGIDCNPGDAICKGCKMKIKHPTAKYISGKYKLKKIPIVTAIQYQSNSDPSEFEISERMTNYTGRKFGKYDECIAEDGPFLFVDTNTAAISEIVNCGDWIVTDGNNDVYVYKDKEFKKLYKEIN